MSWVETVLEEWGTWLRTKGAGQGWGGAVDLDRLFELARAPRTPGVHSDPTYAEFASTAHDGQGRMQTVDRYVRQCRPELRIVARLRYAGILEAVDIPGPKDHRRYIADSAALEGCGGFVLGLELWMSETHGLSVSRISEAMGAPASTIYDRLSRLHQQIRAELQQDARTRKKRADAIPRRNAA